MEGHGHDAAADAEPVPALPAPDRFYTVQVLWDETMADTAARWLAADPARSVVVMAGTGHCHDSAIVARLARRGVGVVRSVRPVVDDGGDAVAAALVEKDNDLLWVMTAAPVAP